MDTIKNNNQETDDLDTIITSSILKTIKNKTNMTNALNKAIEILKTIRKNNKKAK